MEMLDRRKQAVVDDYLADFIDLDAFYERAGTTRWRKISLDYLEGDINRRTFKKRVTKIGWPDWENNYQPMIDQAKEAGAPVVAANTPWRVYTTVARKEGYERLDDVTPAQRALFDVPPEVIEGSYRERFWETMVGRPEGEEPPPPADDATPRPGPWAAPTPPSRTSRSSRCSARSWSWTPRWPNRSPSRREQVRSRSSTSSATSTVTSTAGWSRSCGGDCPTPGSWW
jgi:hypothetical protein